MRSLSSLLKASKSLFRSCIKLKERNFVQGPLVSSSSSPTNNQPQATSQTDSQPAFDPLSEPVQWTGTDMDLIPVDMEGKTLNTVILTGPDVDN
jgi:hypothetical protein